MDDLPIRFSFEKGVAIVSVEGPLDREVVELIEAAIEKLIARERYQIVLDSRQ